MTIKLKWILGTEDAAYIYLDKNRVPITCFSTRQWIFGFHKVYEIFAYLNDK